MLGSLVQDVRFRAVGCEFLRFLATERQILCSRKWGSLMQDMRFPAAGCEVPCCRMWGSSCRTWGSHSQDMRFPVAGYEVPCCRRWGSLLQAEFPVSSWADLVALIIKLLTSMSLFQLGFQSDSPTRGEDDLELYQGERHTMSYSKHRTSIILNHTWLLVYVFAYMYLELGTRFFWLRVCGFAPPAGTLCARFWASNFAVLPSRPHA